MNKHEHSVMVVAGRLVSETDMLVGEREMLADWLSWRVTEGWDATPYTAAPGRAAYDRSVREMAASALIAAKAAQP